MPKIEVISSYDEYGEVSQQNSQQEDASKRPQTPETPPLDSNCHSLDFLRKDLSLENYIHKLSQLIADIETSDSLSHFHKPEVYYHNLSLFTSKHIEEIVSTLRISWDCSKVLCALLSKLTNIFETSISFLSQASSQTSPSRQAQREVWVNVFNLVEKVSERGRIEGALSIPERTSFYALLSKSSHLEAIKAKHLLPFMLNFLNIITMNLEAGFTDDALAELNGFVHILHLAVFSSNPAFLIAVDLRGGELTCGMISVLTLIKDVQAAADTEERLLKLCRELVNRGKNGKARRDVEELKEKCGVLHPVVTSIIG
ncbi:hypothetical protein TrCOL_g3655 [Triparma columacea]|uniref:Uncharacterized protein n=1 Tax=Triparma columacea TaxID=722753 RepID=A0A9W7LEC4_9STRA|nr:hypothetical protein TrCOL_g3655 [Triparma columacea]